MAVMNISFNPNNPLSDSELFLWLHVTNPVHQIDGLVQDCSISSALAMEILQSCTKPSKYAQSCTIGVSNADERFVNAGHMPVLHYHVIIPATS